MAHMITRRAILQMSGVAGGVFLLTSCGIANGIRGIPETDLPQLEDAWAYSDGALWLDLAKLPEISELGGAVRIEGDVLPVPLLVVLGEDGAYYAFKNACTHAGRRLDPVAGAMTLQCCSLSGSTFDFEGNVISGPANGTLTSYPLDVSEGRITIQVG